MHASVVPSRIPAPQAQLLDDVVRVLRAWRRAPLLPAVTLLVALLQLVSGSDVAGLAALGGLLSLLLVGWPGAQRLWYLRLWTGRDLTLAEAWRANLRCFGRFLVLGLVVAPLAGLLLLPAIVPLLAGIEVEDDGTVGLPGGVPAWVVVYSVLATLLGYALLTFITPALVFSSKRVREAIPIGLRLLRVSWPQTWAYVLVPALLAAAASPLGVLSPSDPRAVLGAVVSTLAFALGRGAVAAYYVRTVPGAGPDGAVRMTSEPGYYPPPQQW